VKRAQSARTYDQLKQHYEVEKELANRLRNAPQEERRYLYTALYDELFRRVPLHPQLMQKLSAESSNARITSQMPFVRRFIKPATTFLEIGAGDCALSLEIAKTAKKVYAVDVSEVITKDMAYPDNFQLIISDGSSVPVPANSVNVAYSNQLMEHLHPDDASLQLNNIYKALTPDGVYICITPNRVSGPWDISRYFDTVPSGFHLHEYSIKELSRLFKTVGFSKVAIYFGYKGVFISLPLLPGIVCESLVNLLPYTLRRPVANSKLLRRLLGIRLIGKK
jgi:SAM-dependent methyltransferase